jgi:hypothetical protein
MKDILMSSVSFTMQHINGTASVVVPVWFVFAYTAASLIWPAIAILALATR